MKFFLLIVSLTISTLLAQKTDSTAISAPDSLHGKSNLKYFTIDSTTFFLNPVIDSAQAITFAQLPVLNYQGLADLFRTDPTVQTFDFLEMGLPRFAAQLHLWPQQTLFYQNGFLVNDPTSGLFNTRLLYPDALAWIQNAHSMTDSLNPIKGSGYFLQSRFIASQNPYTRIMYREGDFNYTDLDITFATRLNAKTLLQLGGINRDYAPNYYRAAHYRGQLTRLVGKRSVAQVLFNKSNENVNFLDFFGTEWGTFRYNEVRENILSRFWWLQKNGQIKGQLRAGYQGSRRQYTFFDLSKRLRLRFDRYTFSFEKILHLRSIPFVWQLNTEQVIAWGTPYARKYKDTQFEFFVNSWSKLFSFLTVNSQVSLLKRWDQALQLNPKLKIQYLNPRISLFWQTLSFTRLPTVHERFFNYQNIRGQTTIKPERHWKTVISLNWNPLSRWETNLQLVMHGVKNEIILKDNHFINTNVRTFQYVAGKSKFQFYKFQLMVGGQSALGGTLRGPDYALFSQIFYADRWYHDRVLIKASATAQWIGPAKIVAYQPFAESFYLYGGKWNDRLLLFYKISATIKDAVLFMEMDNVTGLQFQIIKGYPENYRRVRFGLSWVLWN